MPEVRPTPGLIRFGVFELDRRLGEFRKAGVRIGLQEQALQVLLLLLERPGDLVTRDELRQRLWPTATFGDFDHGLNAVINRLRDTLGDSASSPRFIETLPRRGYRFIAPVHGNDAASPTVADTARIGDLQERRGRPAPTGRHTRIARALTAAIVAVVASVPGSFGGHRGLRDRRRG